MTATAYSPPTRHGPTAGPSARGVRPDVRRTAQALLGAALGMLALKGIFSDWEWLADVWVTMVVALGPALWLRRRRPPTALDIWPGIVLMVPWLTLRFLPHHAVAGVVPTSGTAGDISSALRDLHDTTSNSVAPIHSTLAVRLVLCALLGLLAALIDLVAVVGRRGALAGVPLLVVYTVSGAVPRHPVSWVWFVFSAAGFLLLLGLDAGDELDRWGRRFRGSRRPGTGVHWSLSTPRIVVVAVLLAVVTPLAIPGESRNLIANAFHGGSGGGLGGFGGGGGGSISPFAALRGQLTQPTPRPMADVHVSRGGTTQPFYLRVNVLEDYTGDGFQVADHGDEVSVADGNFPTDPFGGAAEDSVQLQARITITGLTGNAPVFAVPSSITGLDGSTWSPKDQILLGDKVSRGQTYVEDFAQPTPTANQLTAAAGSPGADLADNLQLPGNFPSFVHTIVEQLTKRGTLSPYDRARAINDYFTDPASGFAYDLKTKVGDSGSALVDFLKNKRGFCQQYAAAMAVMLRDADVPARVVLGYMHDPTDVNGDFTITSAEAHSWVEAYFSGIGWIPFDPTPASGLVGGSRTDLPWAPHSYANDDTRDQVHRATPTVTSPTSPRASSPVTQPSPSAGTTATPARESGSTSLVALWWVLGVLLAVGIALTPAAVRIRRRRQRLKRARRGGDADELWAELSDTATDLGYVWSPARSPRQVAGWLGSDAGDAAGALRDLAAAVERGRYSGPGTRVIDEPALERGLRDVTGQLRAGRSLPTRIGSLVWPASLSWGPMPRLRRRRSDSI